MRLLVVSLAALLAGCSTTHKTVSLTPITDEMTSEVYTSRFRKEVCQIPDTSKAKKQTLEKCTEQYKETYIRRIGEEYPNATVAVYEKCKTYPIECNNLAQFETWARADNEKNTKLIAEQQEQAAHQANLLRYQHMGVVLQNFGQSMQTRQPTNNCTTMPNGIGGFTTQCR